MIKSKKLPTNNIIRPDGDKFGLTIESPRGISGVCSGRRSERNSSPESSLLKKYLQYQSIRSQGEDSKRVEEQVKLRK